MNILGHGSHTPHAESAIRHLKNKACSTVASLPYPLPSRWAVALIAFVTHTINMVPISSAPGHISAYTNFTGRIPNFQKHTPYAFGTAGFLQKASHASSNSAAPRKDYCIWLGTTRNLAGTGCLILNLSGLYTVYGKTMDMTGCASLQGQVVQPAYNYDHNSLFGAKTSAEIN